MTKPHPFKVGDRIRLLGPGVLHHDTSPVACTTMIRVADMSLPIATVTKLTGEGFEYRYDQPVTVGPARWGMTSTEGTVYPEGYDDWVQVQND